eukprot:COSAG01_NODE_8571_length_2736_cov_1.293895_1_plen_220_part_00
MAVGGSPPLRSRSHLLSRRGHNATPAQISEHLFVASTDALSHQQAPLLRSLSITHILHAAGTTNWTGARQGLQLMQRDITDDPGCDLSPHLQETYAFIEAAREAGGRCLVCSERGISRCASVAAHYLMRAEKLTCKAALERVLRARESCCPNGGFVAQLERAGRELARARAAAEQQALLTAPPRSNTTTASGLRAVRSRPSSSPPSTPAAPAPHPCWFG